MSCVIRPTYLQELSSFLYPDNDTELTGHKEESKGRISGHKADWELKKEAARVHRPIESR